MAKLAVVALLGMLVLASAVDVETQTKKVCMIIGP
jgi:hypothetical protein